MSASQSASAPNSISPSVPPQPLLVVWDFNGVIDTYGSDLPYILQTIMDRGGRNIIVSNGSGLVITDYLAQRQWTDYFDRVYGMDKHHGLVARHKVAAISGHLADWGPFAYTLLVGDSLSDIEDGHEVGVYTCLYDQHQRYNDHHHPADYVIRHLLEVLDLLPV